jgi:hypothetical protein
MRPAMLQFDPGGRAEKSRFERKLSGLTKV